MVGSYPSSVWRRPLPRLASLLAWGLVAICATTIASWSLPGRCGCGRRANESAAIATLRNLASAEDQFRTGAWRDDDHDGRGEFGLLAELASPTLAPPLLSSAFRHAQGGRVTRSGYVFQVFLPGPDRNWRSAPPFLADAAEQRFCAYAWPARQEAENRRVFMVDQTGTVLAATNTAADGHTPRYLGLERPVAPEAAFPPAPGPTTRAHRGQDQQVWRAVQ